METRVLGSTLTKAMQFHQKGHSELKCYSASIKCKAKHCEVVDSHAASKMTISDEKEGKSD